MAEAALDGNSEIALEERFMVVNRDRLQRAYATMSGRQQAFVELLPLLFHVNHPLLPGYISQEVPAGVCDYVPGRTALAAAKQLARTFVYEQRLQRNYAIRGLYLMGSPGTIAYTRQSDLDVWLVHDAGLAEADVVRLREKARRIEDYSQGTGLDLHLFVFDAERFKSGETLSLSDESSGSSQHYLLLDEFYRSGLLLAGLRPLWWAVPPGEEHRYDEYIAEAEQKRTLSPRAYVDFGGLARIPAEEFFGGTVWQLYKSIESPYKSVMKLLLMEAYAAEYPDSGLLSHRYKLALRRDVTLDEIDPYVAMYRKVEEYLLARKDETRLRLLRRAFYIKTSEVLTQPPDPRQPAWRRNNIERLVREWDWSPQVLSHLDQRQRWRIDSAVEERRELVKVLQQSYGALSEFARRFATDKRITQLDLTVLGRKLYAAFDKKPNKIELITRGLCSAPEEAELSLHQVSFERTGLQWMLFDGCVAPDALQNRAPLRRSPSLVDILAWCFFNRLTGAATQWHNFAGGRRQSPQIIRKILDALESAYPQRELPPTELGALGHAPRVARAMFFVNVGLDTVLSGGRLGAVLTSDRTDAFQFGGQRINLVRTIDLLLQTSWEELLCFRFEGEDGIAQAVCEYLKRLGPTPEPVQRTALIHCFDADYANAITQRLGQHLAELVRMVSRVQPGATLHHIVSIGDSFCDIHRTAQGIRYQLHAGQAALLKALAAQPVGFRHVEFGGHLALESPLTRVFASNRPGCIQVFALPVRERIEVFMLSAEGALFRYVHEDADPSPLFDHLVCFLGNVGRNAEMTDGRPAPAIECHVMKPAQGGYALQAVPAAGADNRPYLPLRLFVDLDRDKRPRFVAYLDEAQFSTEEYGNGLFEALARAVLLKRQGRGRYPVYITDLELSPALLQGRSIDPRNVIELLRQKLRIEQQLTQALARDPAPPPEA